MLAIVGLFSKTLLLLQCKKKDDTTDAPPSNNPLSDINNTLGFGLLNKVKGIWNGPVTSSTALGAYPEWIVDFRPISENQISAKNELDSLNDIHMSFFIAKYNNEYRVCFRNGGSFGGQTRVSYFLADSVSETYWIYLGFVMLISIFLLGIFYPSFYLFLIVPFLEGLVAFIIFSIFFWNKK
jgi:hypothetical protein